MAGGKTNTNEEKNKSGKGLDFGSENKDLANGFVHEEDDEGEGLGYIESVSDNDEFRFTINGVELERNRLNESMLTVNRTIPLFDGAYIELTSADIRIIDDSLRGAKQAKAAGGRMVLSPKNTSFVVEVPVTEALLKDDDTKSDSDMSVEGVLKNTFAFPFQNGYLFLANEGLFNDEELESVAGGKLLMGSDTMPADVLITENGIAVGNRENLPTLLGKTTSKKQSGEQEEASGGQETIEEPEQDNQPEIEQENEQENEQVFEGKEFSKMINIFNSEEDEEQDNEQENEDQGIIDTIKGEISEKADEFLEKKKEALKEYLKSKATEILMDSFAAARAGVSLDKLLSDPVSTVSQFKNDLWENFKENVRKQAAQAYEDGKEELKNLPGEVMDEVSGYIWEKEEEVADKIEWAMAVISNAAAFLDIAEYFGVDVRPIRRIVDLVLDAMVGMQEGAEDRLGKVFPKEEGEEEQETNEEGNGKELSITIEIVPGFSIDLFLEPKYSLTFGGLLNLNPGYKNQPITIELGVDAYGFASLRVGLRATAGNDLIAVIGEVSGMAEVYGIVEESTRKFATAGLKDLTIGTVTDNGPVLESPTVSGARMQMAGKLDGTLEAMLMTRSKLFDWERVLLDKKLTANLFTASYEADATKEDGKLFSAKGWHVSNQSLTTAFLDENKSNLIKLSLQEHNISSTEELMGQADSQDKDLTALDGRLSSLQESLEVTDDNEAIGAAFPEPGVNKEDSFADSAAAVLEGIKTDYNAVFVNMQQTSRTMENEIESFVESPEYQSASLAVEEGAARHEARSLDIEQWAGANDLTGLEREDVLEQYRRIASGGRGYAREDRQNTRKEAEDQLYTKENILEYEQAKIKEAEAKRQERYNELRVLYDSVGKDPKKTDTFIKRYQDIVKDDPDGSLMDHLAEYGLETGIFVNDEEAYLFLEDYEKDRFDDATKKLAEGIAQVNSLLALLKEDGKEEEFNKSFSEVFAYIDDDMWEAFVKANTDEEDRLRYYENKAAESDVKNKPRIELLRKLREDENRYNEAKTPLEKEEILKDSKSSFNDLLANTKFSRSMTEWDDFMDSKEQYKRLSAEDIIANAEEYVSNEGFYGWAGSERLDPEGSDIFECYGIFKGDNYHAMRQLLNHNSNIEKIYSAYLNGAAKMTDISSYLAVWNLKDIRDYEAEKTGEYMRRAKIRKGEKVFPDEYFKHHERFTFLNETIKGIAAAGDSEDYYDATGVTADAIAHYFEGTRPDSAKQYIYKKGNKDVKLEIAKAEEYAKMHLRNIKGIRDVADPSFRNRMVEALEHGLDKGKEARQQIADSLKEMSDEDKKDPRKVMKAWTKAGGDIEFMNTRKAADDYGYHEMKSYLEFKIGRKAKKFDEKEFIESAQSAPIEGKESLFTPQKMMDFAEEYRKGIGKKHSDRLDLIADHRSKNAPYSELIKAYNDLESKDSSGKFEWIKKSARRVLSIDHQSGYDSFLEKNKVIRARVTPELIMQFEVERIAKGNQKHFSRFEAVKAASEDKAREVYNNMQGGGGFYSEIKSRITDAASMMQSTRTAGDELQRIKAYEKSKSEKYRQMKESMEKDMQELTAKKNEITERMNTSSDFISSATQKVELLRNRPRNMEQYKSIRDFSAPLSAVRADIRTVAGQKQEVEDLRKRLDAANANRRNQLKELNEVINSERELENTR